MKDALSVLTTILILLGILLGICFLDTAIAITFIWLVLFPFLLSLLSGLLRGIIFRRWQTLQIAINILKANFHFEAGHDYLYGVKIILSRLLWEQPQTLMGNTAMHVLNSVWLLRRTDFYKNTIMCQGAFLNGGGIAFGSFIMIDLLSAPTVEILPMDDRTVPERILLRHEYGHYLQSMASGPLFVFKYGIPSILTQGWTEPDADFRTDKHLLMTEKIMPVFSNHRHQSKPINPKIWEYGLVLIPGISGIIVNGARGLLGGLMIGLVIVSVINLKKPA